jgi:methionyl-tRNA formyltransferase
VSRTAYLGTSDFAATVLRRLAETPHAPELVITPPDRRRGRGRRSLPPPAAEAARELGRKLLQTADVNAPEAVAALRDSAPDVVVVCAFGQLIREPLLSEALMLNVHPSLLPRWRGAAPIERAIMAGDRETGVSVMRVTAGLDSGPVALQEPVPIAPRDDFGSLAPRLAAVGSELLIRSLEMREAGELELAEQAEEGVTYAEKIEPADHRLDPALPAAELELRVRALTPHVGAYLEVDDGERLGVRSAAADAAASSPEPGELAVADGRLLLGCGAGALALEVVQPPGGRPMPIDAYLRGHRPPGRVAAT